MFLPHGKSVIILICLPTPHVSNVSTLETMDQLGRIQGEVQRNVMCGIKLQESTSDPEKRVVRMPCKRHCVVFRPVSMLTSGLAFVHLQYVGVSKLLLNNVWILKK